ncbi:MAG: ABC transporter ATP-binding protein [Evtepia sp.]|uniref:ABC transporter ATP-binding protein n=1 Tax=Evtepia sp. TaxID=2773933 RepID=UPI002A749D25|nr:ABC transporter ATP-binding protein [Evtepia sp.]MDY3015450.1 ABC transporter ATP-binding protein [Evtepia sp.]
MKRSVAYYQKTRPLRIFLSYYGPHKHLFFLDMFCALLICLIDLAFPYLSRSALNTMLPNQAYRAFFTVVLFFAVAYVCKGFLYFTVSYWGHVFGVRVEADLRRDLYAHMENLSFSFFDKNRTGVLMSRVTNDLFEITELAHHGPEDLFISTVTLVGAFCIMCTIEWKLAVISFSIVPVFVVFTIYQRRKMRRANLKLKAQTAEINAAIESGISGMRTAKAFQNEETEKAKFGAMNKLFVQAKSTYYKTMATFQGGMEFSTSIMPVLVIGAGGYFIMKGTVNYADLVAFTLYVTTFTTPVKKLVSFVEQFMQGSAGFTRFLELMRLEPEIQDAPDAEELKEVKGDVTFGQVSFRYNDKAEVLRDINLTIRAEEKFAFVGPSGGGKTTLCQLIPRFYDVTGGQVMVDGKDVRQVTQHSLRRQIGIVQQEVFLFADSVMENIRYGRPEATDEEVMWAARQAEIHQDILAMPNGYDTYVGERGVMLSGGQKQRISIARVFLKNPPIVILDEATSALDSVTEARIQASFDRLCQGRTSIIIAHRLSTIRNADRIAVIDRERILEQGSHGELMALNGEYADLVRAQEQIG